MDTRRVITAAAPKCADESADVLSYSVPPSARNAALWPWINMLGAALSGLTVACALVASGAAISHFESVESGRNLWDSASWERYQALGWAVELLGGGLMLLAVTLGAGLWLRHIRAPMIGIFWLLLIQASLGAALLFGLQVLGAPLWP